MTGGLAYARSVVDRAIDSLDLISMRTPTNLKDVSEINFRPNSRPNFYRAVNDPPVQAPPADNSMTALGPIRGTQVRPAG
jgi:hypothetical protein